MKKFLATVSTVAIMGAAVVGGNSAFAAESTSNISGGLLSMGQPQISNFDNITLNGSIQTTEATVGSFEVIDPRGTGEGWSVWMHATQFTDSTGKVLPQGSLMIGTPTVNEKEGTGSSEADLLTKTGGAIDKNEGLVIISAGNDEGMGTFVVDQNLLTLNLLPKDVKAGNYSTTITVTFPTGP
nr:WxL domain-containing protein [Lysinibacillus timonensis]